MFNQPIESLSKCTKLGRIAFGSDFNQSIEPLAKCTRLEHIIFGEMFNQPIDGLAKCACKYILVGRDFNQFTKVIQDSATIKRRIQFKIVPVD
jgi:hypothetical protein